MWKHGGVSSDVRSTRKRETCNQLEKHGLEFRGRGWKRPSEVPLWTTLCIRFGIQCWGKRSAGTFSFWPGPRRDLESPSLTLLLSWVSTTFRCHLSSESQLGHSLPLRGSLPSTPEPHLLHHKTRLVSLVDAPLPAKKWKAGQGESPKQINNSQVAWECLRYPERKHFTYQIQQFPHTFIFSSKSPLLSVSAEKHGWLSLNPRTCLKMHLVRSKCLNGYLTGFTNAHGFLT